MQSLEKEFLNNILRLDKKIDKVNYKVDGIPVILYND